MFEAPSKSYSSWTKEPYLFVQESKLNELIDERVSRKVNELLEQRASIIFRNITKSKAKEEISGFYEGITAEPTPELPPEYVVINPENGEPAPKEVIDAVVEKWQGSKEDWKELGVKWCRGKHLLLQTENGIREPAVSDCPK